MQRRLSSPLLAVLMLTAGCSSVRPATPNPRDTLLGESGSRQLASHPLVTADRTDALQTPSRVQETVEDKESPRDAASIMLRYGIGASRLGDLSLSGGLEIELPLAFGFSAEAGIHDVTLDDLRTISLGDGSGADIEMDEYDLGARFTYNYLRVDGLRIFPYCSMGISYFTIDERDFEALADTPKPSSDTGGYVRGGINFLLGDSLLIGLDYKRVMDTSFVDYDSVAVLAGLRF